MLTGTLYLLLLSLSQFLPIFSQLIPERMGLTPRTRWSNNPYAEHQDLVWTLAYREELTNSKTSKPVRAKL